MGTKKYFLYFPTLVLVTPCFMCSSLSAPIQTFLHVFCIRLDLGKFKWFVLFAPVPKHHAVMTYRGHEGKASHIPHLSGRCRMVVFYYEYCFPHF